MTGGHVRISADELIRRAARLGDRTGDGIEEVVEQEYDVVGQPALEQRRRLQTVTESAVETLQSSLTSSSTEVAKALGQVANMCAIVAESE